MSKKAWIVAGTILVLAAAGLVFVGIGGIGYYLYRQHQANISRASEPSSVETPSAESESSPPAAPGESPAAAPQEASSPAERSTAPAVRASAAPRRAQASPPPREAKDPSPIDDIEPDQVRPDALDAPLLERPRVAKPNASPRHLAVAPRKLRNVNPRYPEIARSARVQGIVILEARVDAEGRVAKLDVLRSVPLLDQAAIDAVEQWRYEPTLIDGTPVPVIITVTVNFTMR